LAFGFTPSNSCFENINLYAEKTNRKKNKKNEQDTKEGRKTKKNEEKARLTSGAFRALALRISMTDSLGNSVNSLAVKTDFALFS
jgi:hypothetical protein